MYVQDLQQKELLPVADLGRDPALTGHPLHVCEVFNQLQAPVYIARVSVADTKRIMQCKAAIKRLFEIQRDHKGYALLEILAPCPTNFRLDPLKAADSRYLHRGDMNWQAAARRRDQTTPEGRVFAGIKAMEQLRAEHRVFDGAADVWILDTRDDSVLGIGRYYRGEKLLALFNFAERERQVSVNELGDFRDLFSGEAADKFALTIPAGGFLWLLCDFDEK